MTNHKQGRAIQDVAWFRKENQDQKLKATLNQIATETFYATGNIRQFCIICSEKLTKVKAFQIRSIVYTICDHCGHINGNHELTAEFLNYAYGSFESDCICSRPYSDEFTQSTMATDFDSVVQRIYEPKASFLLDQLSGHCDATEKDVLDFGCGSGHFVKALQNVGFKNVHGVDSLPVAVDQAALNGLNESVSLVSLNSVDEIFASKFTDIVTMLCVLPHLKDPCKALESMIRSGVRWTFQKVPMFSIGLLLESAMPEQRSRIIGSDHTNIFTWESINWIEKNYHLKRLASWSFGSDALDFANKIRNKLGENGTEAFSDWALRQSEKFLQPMQDAVDSVNLSSELHILWELPLQEQIS